MKSLLKNIRSTLDTIEIKGRGNLDALLGCMNALDTVIAAMEQLERADPVKTEEEKKEEADG